MVNTLPQWKALKSQLMILPSFAADTETTGLAWVNNKIIGLSFSWGAENSYYVPVRHETDDKQLKIEDILDDLIEIFGRYDLITIWHNGKFDFHFLLNEGIHVKGVIHDTLILHKLLKEEGSAELKDLACLEIDENADMWEVAIDNIRTKLGKVKIPAPLPGKPDRMVMRKKKNVHYGLVDVDNMTPYAASDTHYAWLLWKKKFVAVAEDPHLRQLYLMECQLLRDLLDTEHRGVLIDRKYLGTVGPKLEKEAEQHEQKVRDYFQDPDLNVNSPKELIKVLNEQGITWRKKTKSKQPSLDAEVLENLAKKGQPSRAEITDAAMSQRAECVMLNKGPHIVAAIDLSP